jgi:hypothetical protein
MNKPMLAWRFVDFRWRKVRSAQKVRPSLIALVHGLGVFLFVISVAATVANEGKFAKAPRLGESKMANKTSWKDSGATKAEGPEASSDTAVAAAFRGSVDVAGFPPSVAWGRANPLRFDTDWQGKNADPERATEVRLLWTPATLYLRFLACYRVVTVFWEADANGRRDQLWDRDVAEVFLQPDSSEPRHYKEFEVSPNAFWIDLDIENGKHQDLRSGMQRRVTIDKAAKRWTAELAIPMHSLVDHFQAEAVWRVNFYRVEGPTEPRFYSAWRPTKTPQPNFHVPELFGRLIFEPAPR